MTVSLPFRMNSTHTDERLLEFAIHEIRRYRAIVYQIPQHAIRHECISFAVDINEAGVSLEQVTRAFMAQAEVVARYWLRELRAGRVTLDRDRIFCVGLFDAHYDRETRN